MIIETEHTYYLRGNTMEDKINQFAVELYALLEKHDVELTEHHFAEHPEPAFVFKDNGDVVAKHVDEFTR